ncbi:MAG TPA: hypothetical protein VHE35_02465 [Kofleriaceae bacterium]|nr:hypothetical protein [Kofleriaceae bacterium]
MARVPPGRPQYGEAQLGARIAIEDAQLVVINDGWNGMNDDAPFVTVHELRRGADGALAGEARQYRRSAFVRAQPVTLRATDATKFLRLLARAPCGPGPYQNLMEHTDDWPSIDIAVHVRPEAHPSGIVLFHSTSQGDYHTPWCISVHGELFASAGDECGRALAMARRLVPPLPPVPELFGLVQ